MALIGPAAELVVDNPDADGLLEKHGYAYDWRFEPGKNADPVTATSLHPSWIGENCELVPVLHALGLRGYATKVDMELGQWQIVVGEYWKTARPAGRPRAKYLFWHDARPNQSGSVLSRGEFEPRVALWAWRFSPPDGQTDLVMLEITLHGNGLGPAYSLQIPLHDYLHKYPRLWRHEVGEAGPHLVDELQRYDAARMGMSDDAAEQQVWIEETDGVLVMNLTGAAEPWVYKPEDGQGPSRGHVSVTFRGHCGLFNLQPIQYPSQGTAQPSSFIAVPEWMTQTPQYLPVTGGVGAAVASEDPASGSGLTRPVVTLVRTQSFKRPVVYTLHQYHEPQFRAGVSTPRSTAGDENLLKLRWRRRLYRGWRFWAELRDFERVYDWRGNEKVSVKAGWESAATQVMVGYLSGPARRRETGEYLGRSTVEIEGRDYIAGRLAGRKYMAWYGSPVGWNFAQWFTHVLRRSGVPPSLLEVADDGYVIEAAADRRRTRYQFRNDVDVVQALDELVRSRGWVWGVNEQGKIWAGPRAQYGGVADFVLDDKAVREEERLVWVEAERAAEGFRNYVAVFSSAEGMDAAIWHDEASHRDRQAAAFIGDDWWEVIVAPDEREPWVAAWQTFQETRQWRCDILWETSGQPGLKPGQFVEVRVGGLGVPEGVVFQIVEDVGILDRQEGVFRSVFLAKAIDV